MISTISSTKQDQSLEENNSKILWFMPKLEYESNESAMV